MAKAKQNDMDDMDTVMDVSNPDAMTDQERDNLQMQLNESNKRMTKTNKKSM